MLAPWVNAPDEYTEMLGGAPSSPIVLDDGGSMVMGDLGAPHKPLVIVIFGLLLIKVATELRGANLPLSEVRVTVLNWVVVTAMAITGFTLLKVGNAMLLKRGVIVPGAADFLGAL